MAVLNFPGARCERCGDNRYIVRADGEVAVAEVCTCNAACPICSGTGRAVRVVDGVRMLGRCRCQALPDRVSMWNDAGIPARYARCTLVSFTQGMERDPKKTPAMGAVTQWQEKLLAARRASAPPPGLVLHGQVGRGKTHLLVGITRWAIFELGLRARFIEFTRLLGMLKEGYDRGESDRDVLNDLVSVPVLGIDELGKGRLTDWELAVVDELVSRRYNAMATTLGTTNFAPGLSSGRGAVNLAEGRSGETRPVTQTLGDRVGDRVYSRLLEMSQFVEVGGIDFRDPVARR